jgi:hypothetical protein
VIEIPTSRRLFMISIFKSETAFHALALSQRIGTDRQKCASSSTADSGYNDRTSLKPASTSSITDEGSRPIRLVKKPLSKVNSCELFTTEFFERPLWRRARRTFPGAAAKRRFDEIAATKTV